MHLEIERAGLKTPQLSTGPLKKADSNRAAAWQAAMDAYSEIYRRARRDLPARNAAETAYLKRLPNDPDAPMQIAKAIAYGATYRGPQFYTG